MDEKRVEIITQGTAGVVTFLTASISDVEEINAISKRIKEYVEKTKPIRLIFDFGQVKFFSSQVLGMLLDMRAKLSANDGQVSVISINPQLHRIFRITNLDKIFSFFPDVDSAIKNEKKTSKE